MSLSTAVRELPGIGDVMKGRDDKALIKDLDQLFNQAKTDREQYERQWLINMAFVYDQQWVYWSETTRKLERPIVPKWRVLMVVNKIKGIVRTEYAKLIQHTPQAKANPASGEVDDRNQAEVCDAILSFLDATDGSEKAQKRALLWSLIVGTGILESYWNPDKGDVLTYPEMTMVDAVDPTTGQPTKVEQQHPKAGQEVVDKQGNPVHMGDIETCEVSPFEFYPDPFGLDIDHKNWAFKVSIRSAEYVQERFGIEVTPKEITTDQFIEGQLATLTGNQGTPRKGIVVKEFRQRSNKKYPNGRYIVYVDEKVLVNQENPYPKWQMNYASFVHVPVAGRFWGDSMVTSLIDPQKNLNKSRSQAIEHRNLMAKGKYFVAKGALDVGKTITDMPGEVVEYNQVAGVTKPIEMVSGAAIPDSFWKDIQQSISEIREVSGVNEVSDAGVPAGVTAGRAIGLLQEQDDLRLTPTSQDYEAAIGTIGEGRIHLAKQYYDEPRTIRIAGKDNAIKVVQFRKEDIPDEVDIRVVAGSALPKSRVARMEMVRGLWKDKMLPDLRVALRMLELGEIDGLYDEVNRDINQVERENERMKNGDQPQVRDFHNHHVHINGHDGHRKGEEYEQATPQEQALFDQHVADHQAALAQAALMAAQTGVQPGAPAAPAAPADAIGSMAQQAGAPQSGIVGDTGQMPSLI